MTARDVGCELDFTDSHKWSADGWCLIHSTDAGPVYCTDADRLHHPERYPKDEVDAAIHRMTDPEHLQ